MKLNSTENDETAVSDERRQRRRFETRVAKIMNDNEDADVDDDDDDDEDEGVVEEEIFFVELNSREMPIDCPEGYVDTLAAATVKRASAAAAAAATAPHTTNAQANNSMSNKNMLIKPLLSILLKSGAKITSSNQKQASQNNVI